MLLDIQIFGHTFLENFIGTVLLSSSIEYCFRKVWITVIFFSTFISDSVFFLSLTCFCVGWK